MVENKKRYYWIKLKTDFFDEDVVDFMLSQPNGAQYVVLYQMICLKTVNSNGKLQKEFGEIIVPFDIEKVVRECKYFDRDTVRVAMELYKQLGLIYVDENGILSIQNYDNMIGSETNWAEKKRIYRNSQKQITSDNYKNNLEDISKDNSEDKKRTLSDKSIEYRDKSIEKEKDISKDISQKKDKYKQMIDEYTEDKDQKDSLYSWQSQRRSEKKFSLDALKRNLANLKKLGSNDYERNEIVNQSIMNGWKGFFPTNKAKPTFRPPREDINPVYDSSNNPTMTEEEIKYYLKLIREGDEQQEKT